MGRWAQAKRRGGGVSAGGVLGAPLAPRLFEDGGSLWTESYSPDNTGGFLRLEWRPDEETAFEMWGSAPWAAFNEWASTDTLDPGDYRAIEIGNGSTYVGESAPSALYHL